MIFKRLILSIALLSFLFLWVGASAYADSFPQQIKKFDKDKIEQLKESGDFDYVEAKPANTSLLQRFLNYLNNLINKFFSAATGTPLGRVLLYIGLFVLLMVALVKIFSINVKDVFYGTSDKGNLGFELLDEDLDQLDLEALLSKALGNQDYRLAVRVVYLKALRSLNEAQLIVWESGKTNHDYLLELSTEKIKSQFDSLCYYFDYAWYGEFEVNQETYQKAADQADFIQKMYNQKRK